MRTDSQINLDKGQQGEGNKKRSLEVEKTEKEIIDALPSYEEEVGEYDCDTSV